MGVKIHEAGAHHLPGGVYDLAAREWPFRDRRDQPASDAQVSSGVYLVSGVDKAPPGNHQVVHLVASTWRSIHVLVSAWGKSIANCRDRATRVPAESHSQPSSTMRPS